ncbi:Phosphoribosylamine--glycine ligase [compost metagenome]
MRVVVVGKGGREHALAQKLKESCGVTDLWVCPGNPGMQKAGLSCVSAETPESIEKFCIENQVSLVVVGPENLILSDLKTRLEEQGIACFAPSRKVAELESSKLFCKGILNEAAVPTAACLVSYSREQALDFISKHGFSAPLVLKADGLAQGKGVWVCESLQKAQEALDSLSAQFGFPILLEECLVGRELSAFALCDGRDFVILGTACDYKRITPDPFSANTGGMGAYSPCDFITPEEEQEIHQIFARTLNCLADKKMPFQGFLFAGLMKTEKGLYVLEYNVRMGDPETQALLPRIETDFCSLIVAAVTHQLAGKTCLLKKENSLHVVATSKGYPQAKMDLGFPITYSPSNSSQAQLFFAGVSERNSSLLNSGGRVLGVTALGVDKEQARSLAYQEMRKISFEGMYIREDIGQ